MMERKYPGGSSKDAQDSKETSAKRQSSMMNRAMPDTYADRVAAAMKIGKSDVAASAATISGRNTKPTMGMGAPKPAATGGSTGKDGANTAVKKPAALSYTDQYLKKKMLAEGFVPEEGGGSYTEQYQRREESKKKALADKAREEIRQKKLKAQKDLEQKMFEERQQTQAFITRGHLLHAKISELRGMLTGDHDIDQHIFTQILQVEIELNTIPAAYRN